MDEPHFISAGEAARILGFSTTYLGYLARNERIAFEMTPYGRIYDLDVVLRLKEARYEAQADKWQARA